MIEREGTLRTLARLSVIPVLCAACSMKPEVAPDEQPSHVRLPPLDEQLSGELWQPTPRESASLEEVPPGKNRYIKGKWREYLDLYDRVGLADVSGCQRIRRSEIEEDEEEEKKTGGDDDRPVVRTFPGSSYWLCGGARQAGPIDSDWNHEMEVMRTVNDAASLFEAAPEYKMEDFYTVTPVDFVKELRGDLGSAKASSDNMPLLWKEAAKGYGKPLPWIFHARWAEQLGEAELAEKVLQMAGEVFEEGEEEERLAEWKVSLGQYLQEQAIRELNGMVPREIVLQHYLSAMELAEGRKYFLGSDRRRLAAVRDGMVRALHLLRLFAAKIENGQTEDLDGLDMLLLALLESPRELGHTGWKYEDIFKLDEEHRGVPRVPTRLKIRLPDQLPGRIAYMCAYELEKLLLLMDETALTRAVNTSQSWERGSIPRVIPLGDQIASIVAFYAGLDPEGKKLKSRIWRWYADVGGKGEYEADLAELRDSCCKERQERLGKLMDAHPHNWVHLERVFLETDSIIEMEEIVKIMDARVSSEEDRAGFRRILKLSVEYESSVMNLRFLAQDLLKKY